MHGSRDRAYESELPDGTSGPGEVPADHHDREGGRPAPSEETDRLYAPESEDTGGRCTRATKAAMAAVADNCGMDVQPIELPNGVIVNVPIGAVQEIEQMSPGELSDETAMEMLDDMEPVEEMAEEHCSMAGLREDTEQFDTCQVLFLRALVEGV